MPILETTIGSNTHTNIHVIGNESDIAKYTVLLESINRELRTENKIHFTWKDSASPAQNFGKELCVLIVLNYNTGELTTRTLMTVDVGDLIVSTLEYRLYVKLEHVSAVLNQLDVLPETLMLLVNLGLGYTEVIDLLVAKDGLTV